jgi:hypothetical protein
MNEKELENYSKELVKFYNFIQIKTISLQNNFDQLSSQKTKLLEQDYNLIINSNDFV